MNKIPRNIGRVTNTMPSGGFRDYRIVQDFALYNQPLPEVEYFPGDFPTGSQDDKSAKDHPEVIVEGDHTVTFIMHKGHRIRIPREILIDLATIMEWVEDEQKFVFAKSDSPEKIRFGELYWDGNKKISAYWTQTMSGWQTSLPAYHSGKWHVPLPCMKEGQ